MQSNQRTNKIISTPKVFQAPQDKVVNIWPKIIMWLSLILIVVTAIIYMIFFSSWFKIKNIEIIGNPSETIKSNLNGLVGKNLFSFNAGHVEQSFMDIDRNYLKIKIYRGIPDTVRIVFTNRDPKIIWQTNGSQYFVDQTAFIFKAADNSVKLPVVVDKSNLVVKVPMKISTEDFVNFVLSADAELLKNKFKIINFEVSETMFQVSAVTDGNLRIMFNTLRPLSEQIDAFGKVYEQNKQDIKEYVDLRVEGKVYFK